LLRGYPLGTNNIVLRERNRAEEMEYEQQKINSTDWSISGLRIQENDHSCGDSSRFDGHADCAMNNLICLVAEYISGAPEKKLMWNVLYLLNNTMHIVKDIPEQQ